MGCSGPLRKYQATLTCCQLTSVPQFRRNQGKHVSKLINTLPTSEEDGFCKETPHKTNAKNKTQPLKKSSTPSIIWFLNKTQPLQTENPGVLALIFPWATKIHPASLALPQIWYHQTSQALHLDRHLRTSGALAGALGLSYLPVG